MRTDVEENARLGAIVAGKANAATGPVSIFLPLRGVSILDSPGNEFWWPEADQALFDAIKSNVNDKASVTEMDCNVNDMELSEAVTHQLLSFLRS